MYGSIISTGCDLNYKRSACLEFTQLKYSRNYAVAARTTTTIIITIVTQKQRAYTTRPRGKKTCSGKSFREQKKKHAWSVTTTIIIVAYEDIVFAASVFVSRRVTRNVRVCVTASAVIVFPQCEYLQRKKLPVIKILLYDNNCRAKIRNYLLQQWHGVIVACREFSL